MVDSITLDNSDGRYKKLLSPLMYLFKEVDKSVFKPDLYAPQFQKIINVSQEHFKNEAVYMKATDYPHLEKHCFNHQLINAELGKLYYRSLGGQDVSNKDIYDVLQLFFNHFRFHDQSFIEYLGFSKTC